MMGAHKKEKTVVVVDDGTITAGLLTEHLPGMLSEFGARTSFVKLRPKRMDFLTSDKTVIKEYFGCVEDLKKMISEANVLVVHKAPVTREIIKAVPGLRLIACARGGPANVDLAAAAEIGIPVVYAPGRAAAATADFTMGLLIALSRKLLDAFLEVRSKGSGAWGYDVRSAVEGYELFGKTLGIIGFGEVGKRVAKRAAAFGMHILVCDPPAGLRAVQDAGVEPVSLDELLSRSDFVSLHARAGPDEAPVLGQRELYLMKNTAFLINTSRGHLVDEKALCEVLHKKRIKGAALDVLVDEPPGADNPIMTLENVLITPHVGGKAKEVPLRSVQVIASEIIRFLRGERLMNVITGSDF